MTKVSWKAALFDKAIGDLWSAKQICDVRPDYALYHSQQAVEKTIKGAMNCYGLDTFAYMGDHDIIAPLQELLKVADLSESAQELCKKFEAISPSIRYSSMKSDPTVETARQYIADAESIMVEIAKLPSVQKYYREAKEVNDRILQGKA